ncbi:MAG TPA: replication-relaxation family protein [Pyrinomonadaceae bacterium]
MQQRLRKYTRDQSSLAALASRQITDTSLAVIATIYDYRIIPTSLLTRLVPGHEKNICRHLQQLYHKRLVNRFAFMRGRNAGEFHYYLDNTAALELLISRGVDPESLDRDEVRRNKEKAYCEVNDPKRIEEMQGKLLFLKHEAMISRFHAMLELACGGSKGEIELSNFQQGPALWHKVEVPKLSVKGGQWSEADQTESLPHRPDAFFTLSFPEGGREPLHFFYEADRHRTNAHKYNKKLRAHFNFIVKQKIHQQIYGINRIKAVLTETIDDEWAERLRQAAGHEIVSGNTPSLLFWFTSSRLFTEKQYVSRASRTLPTYLHRPDIVLQKIWASPVNDTLHCLID